MDPFLCLAALLPLASLLLLLLRGWPVGRAAAACCLLAAGGGLAWFDGSIWLLAEAALLGSRHAIPIISVVFLTLLLYAWAERSGALRRLQQLLAGCSADRTVQALVIGWLFVHVLQGISGFGVPVLVGAPLLLKVGLAPARAVIIALLGQCWGNTFGTLGLAWDGMMQQVMLAPPAAGTALWLASSYLLLVCIATGWGIAWLAGGWQGFRRTFWLVLLLGIVQGEGQTILAAWNPELANLLASLLGLGAFLLIRSLQIRRKQRFVACPPQAGFAGDGAAAGCITWLQPEALPGCLRYACRRTWPVAISILLLLILSEIMAVTGQTRALASGLAAVAGSRYLAAASLVGLLGSFMTASNLSSNILFASFQQQMAVLLQLAPAKLLALQTAGGAVGTLLSPSNILLGTTAAGIAGREREVLRATLPAALLLASGFGLLALAAEVVNQNWTPRG